MTFILDDKQARELELLIHKIRIGTVTKREIDRFQFLVRRVNYNIDKEFHDFLLSHGYVDVKNFLDDYHNDRNQEFIEGLVMIGLGVLAGYAIYRLLQSE